jgi:hypothetical protein
MYHELDINIIKSAALSLAFCLQMGYGCVPPFNDEEEVGRVEGSIAVSVERRKAMQKNMPKLGAVLMIAVVAAWVGG